MEKKRVFIGTIAFILLLGVIIVYFTLPKSEKSTIAEIDYDSSVDTSNLKTKSISSDYNITEEGAYSLEGEINSTIYINVKGKVKLVLNNASITASEGPAIYIENGDVVIELIGENTISDLSKHTLSDDNDSAAIYSKDDLYFEGEGSLTINANYADAIVSKDSLYINGGTYTINAKDDALRGKDSVVITAGTFNVEAGGDGIKATNEEDDSLGYVVIEGGTFNINTKDDGISAISTVLIKGGDINIVTDGGSTKATVYNEWSIDNTSTDAKGIVADSLIQIDDGTIVISSTDDALHSNGNLTINGGDIKVTSDDDAIHADAKLIINGGTISLNAHEGLEATYVEVNDGDINIKSSDDGINAGKKSDLYTPTIEINGGSITIVMGSGDTDAIDSNGNLYINGGYLNITGASAFDYDGEAKYTGGTMIVNGSETTTITNQFMGGGTPGDDNSRYQRMR